MCARIVPPLLQLNLSFQDQLLSLPRFRLGARAHCMHQHAAIYAGETSHCSMQQAATTHPMFVARYPSNSGMTLQIMRCRTSWWQSTHVQPQLLLVAP